MAAPVTGADGTPWGQRCALIFLGALLGLGVLEIALRTAGWVILRGEAGRNPVATVGDGTVRILCIGESTTFLGGEDAYPRQLERLLNARPNGPRVTVANAGIPAVTSEYLLARVPGWFATYDPDIVIAMMGVNDPRDEPSGALRATFESFRVVKLVRWGIQALGSGRWPADSGSLHLAAHYLRYGQIQNARRVIDTGLELDPQDLHLLVGRAAVAAREMLPVTADESIATARAIAGSSPERHLILLAAAVAMRLQPLALEEADWLRSRVSPDSPRWGMVKFRLGMEVDRLIAARFLDEAEATLALMAALPRVPDERAYEARVALLVKARGNDAEYDERQRQLAVAGGTATSPMTVRTYRQLRDLVHGRGGRLVAVQYAMRPLRPLEDLLERDPRVVFVSTEEPFRRVLADTPYDAIFTDAFAGDFGHATPRGNELLAQTIADALTGNEVLTPRAAASP
jgi:hypothetical protein